MEYVSPEQVKLSRLLGRNRLLSLVLGVIVIVLLVFVAKHGLLAWISVEQSGRPLNNVPEILKAGLAGFFESFGELSGRYFLLVSLMLLINAVGITANVLLKLTEKKTFYYMLLIASIVIAFSLPMDSLWPHFVKQGKTTLFLFCMGAVLVFPYIIPSYLAKDAIRTMIIRKLMYILILGLLVVQMIIE